MRSFPVPLGANPPGTRTASFSRNCDSSSSPTEAPGRPSRLHVVVDEPAHHRLVERLQIPLRRQEIRHADTLLIQLARPCGEPAFAQSRVILERADELLYLAQRRPELD